MTAFIDNETLVPEMFTGSKITIVLDGPAAERAARILIRRGVAHRRHSSPHCACGFNTAGEEFVDPICLVPSGNTYTDGSVVGVP